MSITTYFSIADTHTRNINYATSILIVQRKLCIHFYFITIKRITYDLHKLEYSRSIIDIEVC